MKTESGNFDINSNLTKRLCLMNKPKALMKAQKRETALALTPNHDLLPLLMRKKESLRLEISRE